ncbi:helix-turn-helix domain-containing protein [Alkalibacillus salilacus]|uniref:XRE family transcriptional regulator n=1 Tax=Alkalibacillus salilacus TaxID=284582 RepID=A0ABT9VD00_9BACI|nr:helix-turn-helix transcriptional regulator [Alkalibacillus salilacus]MDQ0158848.1 hypothetical protein [Alkalibacillus salilacus]
MTIELDLEYLKEILKTYYKSKSDMAKCIGITRSHLQEVFNGRGVGPKLLEGLKEQANSKGFIYEQCLLPQPIIMGDKKIASIEITDSNNNLLASISSRDIISEKNTTVIVVPHED